MSHLFHMTRVKHKMVKKILATLFVMTIASYASAEPIVTDSTSRSTSETTVHSPPPTAVAPAITTINNDVCAVAASGAVQTQILGFSMGATSRDMNCERIKLAKNLYDMGMKVAAVATLCQDQRVFSAMLAAGTPCPIDGKIGAQAKEEWNRLNVLANQDKDDIGYYSQANSKPAVSLDDDTRGSERQSSTSNGNEQQGPFGCAGYRGTDPIIIARVCNK